MKNKIFNKKLSKYCKNCSFSVETAGEDLLCRHRGAVQKDDCCRKYQYDPLKEPRILLTLKKTLIMKILNFKKSVDKM